MARTTQVKNNPSQNWRASHIQFAGGRNDGFAAAFAEPPKLPEPTLRWGSWSQPRQRWGQAATPPGRGG